MDRLRGWFGQNEIVDDAERAAAGTADKLLTIIILIVLPRADNDSRFPLAAIFATE